MRLPHSLLSNPFFQFSRLSDLLAVLGNEVGELEIEEIEHLCSIGLPPVTSENVICAVFGFNPGFVWSLLNKKHKYYRRFEIPKGQGVRVIYAPRLGLKVIQKWLSLRLSEFWVPDDSVYGFVVGRSHVDAAARHCGARWAFSCDIENFFPSTSQASVERALIGIGYKEKSAKLIAEVCCYQGALAQGSPASPVLSNICAAGLDKKMLAVRDKYGCVYTRYADDMVFSGEGEMPRELEADVLSCFDGEEWEVAEGKTYSAVYPGRIKVHGLLVGGGVPRLTKGYRNRLRAYRHLLERDAVVKNASVVMGHLAYEDFVRRKALPESE
ncbi:Reverse transcriptase (RNA-dependent DNA polymerase) [Azotobacter beijerinckii]|uniref:RNA-directed DNA polymerase n=2 Tax=Azotobacter beijerinckii TaxID=170623 RepID=A0A1H6XI62_9GAMM|nr:Reverse transcriptase (RNA-dependent DNA polymerase) [Azotobacter beijerinckii]